MELEELGLSKADMEFIYNLEKKRQSILNDIRDDLEKDISEKNSITTEDIEEKFYISQELKEYKNSNKSKMGDARAISILAKINKNLIENITGREEAKKELNLTNEQIIEIVKKDPKAYFDLLQNLKLKKLNIKMGIKYLDIKNFREFYSDLREKLSISSKKEQEIYEFLEDVYNHYEDDKIATHKCFTKIEESTSFNFTEKLYAMILLSMLNLKTQQKRKEIASQKRSFKNTFDDDDEYTDDDGDDE